MQEHSASFHSCAKLSNMAGFFVERIRPGSNWRESSLLVHATLLRTQGESRCHTGAYFQSLWGLGWQGNMSYLFAQFQINFKLFYSKQGVLVGLPVIICNICLRLNIDTGERRLSWPRLSGFLNYLNCFSSPNFVMHIH